MSRKNYPKATSKIIIITNPTMIPIVAIFDFLSSCASGINSFATTYIIEPAANASKYGKIGTTIFVNAIVIIAPIGSTIPDNIPYKNDFAFDFPSALTGIDIIAPSGIF